MKLPAIFCIFILFTELNAQPIQELNLNSNWEFRGADTLSWMAAEVPGTVHTDLLRNKVIEDPFYRTNERDQQWIDKRDWEYRLFFNADRSVLQKDIVELHFEGLDTFADVYLNDSLILESDNFFRNWSVRVKEYLKTGRNELRIYFHSPIKVGLEGLDELGYPLPATNDQSENGGLGDKKVSVFTRKPGYHYGWDWGPRFVTSGIWAPVQLKAWDAFRIEDVYVHQKEVNATNASLEISATLSSETQDEAKVAIYFDGKELMSEEINLNKGLNNISFPIGIDSPELWWTHDLGDPYLYDFRFTVETDDHWRNWDDLIGIRSINLVREKDGDGESFYFELNGVPIFSKGANYIPQDSFIPRVRDEQYKGIIESAVGANMNMIRVWGGGFYEKDIFYDLCDRAGILVWQDFMFGCSMYPGDEAFLENVRMEAVDNVKRLRNHASIALWCGNNEIDVAWSQYDPNGGWGWKQRYDEAQKKEIWSAYEKLFHELLPSVVDSLSSNIAYWPSSPWTGGESHAGYQTPTGDIHYWGVWHGEHAFEEFRNYIGRFMSEFGFQSFPEFRTVREFTLPGDWDIESEVMAAHQRSGIGNLRIRSYMDQYYKVPDSFEDLLYVGQVLQADGMRMGFEAHRRAMPYCMGSLYWQINDCWPVASWSGMDYYQRWKGLHYFVKKAFAPILISPYEVNDSLFIQIVSDELDDRDLIMTMQLMDFNGGVIWNEKSTLAVPAQQSIQVFERSLNDLVDAREKKNTLLFVKVEDHRTNVLASNIFYFEKVKNLNLPVPDVQYKIDYAEGDWVITLSTDHLAKNMFLKFDQVEGHFSDNYFDLLPGEEVNVRFTPDNGQGNDHGKLLIKSIRDTYK